MLKISYFNIFLYIFVKYIAFYAFMMFRNNDFTLIRINELKRFEDWYYYLWIFLFLPIINSLIFSVPIYFSFKAKNPIYFFVFIIIILLGEYFLYTYFASESDLMNGVYNGIISLLFLNIFFFKQIRSKFVKSPD